MNAHNLFGLLALFDVSQDWYFDNYTRSHATGVELENLVKQTKLDKKQVKQWLSNARKRLRVNGVHGKHANIAKQHVLKKERRFSRKAATIMQVRQ